MKYTVFDCETVGLAEDQLPPFDESSVLVGNLKDPEKVRAKVESARAEWLANAALSPLTGKVAMVGFKTEASLDLIADDEKEILSRALYRISCDLSAGIPVVGFACYSFDLPFLAKRAWVHGGTPGNIRSRYRGRSYWNENLIDLREEWLMGEHQPAKGTSSLDSIARFLGLPPKLGSGADFAGLDLEQRKVYLTRDLEITEALYRRICRP